VKLVQSIALPSNGATRFDHADVHLQTGSVFLAHTARGTVEVIDGAAGGHVATIVGCPEASGVLCAQDDGVVFAAARGAGKILAIGVESTQVQAEIRVGPRPNGLAWDTRRRQLLVADVEERNVRLVDHTQRLVVSEAALPGRPRWCVYDRPHDRFLVNIREPACVSVVAAGSLEERHRWPVSGPGPHGLDVDFELGRLFVACDAGVVTILDLATGRERGTVAIAGEPDVIWHSARRRRLYVAIGQPGVIDVIDTALAARVEQIATEPGAHTTAFDPTRGRLYAFLPQSARAVAYDEA
jgi:DNA-binding beta-propeller fold protein YncE